jgi:uncharacterized membrane protein
MHDTAITSAGAAAGDQVLAGRGLSTRERAPLWRLRWRVREGASSSLALIPSLYLLGAIGLGLLLPAIDRGRSGGLVGLTSSEVQSILESVAAGMIAFSGLVVSVAVLVVQFGAGQYSPRLVQVFRRDRVLKNALGLFVVPGVYALVAAADVGGSSSDRPQTLTVVVALVLMVVALAALFRFIGRLLDLMRPRQIYGRLMRHIGPAIEEFYPEASAERDTPSPIGLMPITATVRHRHRDEVLAAVDCAHLVRVARTADAVIEVRAQIGSHIPDDASILAIHGGSGIAEPKLLRALIFADGRRLPQDPGFAIRCIVDVTVRALSAAINDPTSAVEGLDALEALLRRLGRRTLEVSAILDHDGVIRLVLPTPNWDELIDLALTEIRWYGASSPQVARRLAALLDGLEATVPEGRREAVVRHRRLLEDHLRHAYENPEERAFAATPDRLGIGGRRGS